jgi:hypothetical protein
MRCRAGPAPPGQNVGRSGVAPTRIAVLGSNSGRASQAIRRCSAADLQALDRVDARHWLDAGLLCPHFLFIVLPPFMH